MHVAHINYGNVLKSAFADSSEAERFVNSVEEVSAKFNTPAVIIHQAARLVWLADRIEEVAKARPALQIFFFLIAAEAVTKLFYKYRGEGKSKAYVKKFFHELCTDEHRKQLSSAIKIDEVFMTADECVNFLYKIRCDVAHEGRYFQLFLPETTIPPDTSLVQSDSIGCYYDDARVDTYISASALREIIVQGSVRASRMSLAGTGAP